MGAHEYPKGDSVHSSPANVQHYQIRGHARNNPHLSLPSHAQTDRFHMMSDALHTTVPLLFETMMNTYLPAVDPDGFDTVYSSQRISAINAAFKVAAAPPSKGRKDTRPKEKIVSEAWVCHSSVRLKL